jgi:hypothetical protein
MGERINRLFSTVNESQDAFLDVVRANNERAYRFSKIVIEEAARTQQEQTDLAKQWMESPMDTIGLTRSAIETWTRRQRRRFELTRTFFNELGEVRDETRDAVQRVTSATREAVGVGAEAGREAAVRAGQAGRQAAVRVGEAGVNAAARVSEEIAERTEDMSEAVDEAARSVRTNARNARKRNGS